MIPFLILGMLIAAPAIAVSMSSSSKPKRRTEDEDESGPSAPGADWPAMQPWTPTGHRTWLPEAVPSLAIGPDAPFKLQLPPQPKPAKLWPTETDVSEPREKPTQAFPFQWDRLPPPPNEVDLTLAPLSVRSAGASPKAIIGLAGELRHPLFDTDLGLRVGGGGMVTDKWRNVVGFRNDRTGGINWM
jgi:hypothetical protein